MKRILPLFSLALCVAAAWLYFTPYRAYGKVTDAAERGDVAALNEVVDFPALRTSFKENVKTAVTREISGDSGNPFAAMGGALAGMLTGPVIDAAVTPSGIAALTKGNDPRNRDRDRDEKDEARRSDVERDRRYEGMNRFAVRYLDRETGAEQYALIMTRDGLGWKLSGVRFGRDADAK
ncbi:DUF2939 domain-containing protein [Longimicrobium sp.]|uniref:DUF2939 domain-containing protein n=1 Tax=Longimicrobium sp. TaxID=2029185 RepID=UPI002E34C33D|nr:DUF2939 domain-containing protein [Longimicrobium sp.]HEX6036500.1 DUF2939 domain-containing protein [Longimicrobium sp.]